MLQSSGSFSIYLLGYYSKYFPGSFFVNFTAIGFADMVAPFYGNLLHKLLKTTKNVVTLELTITCVLSVVFILFAGDSPIKVMIGILLIRLNMISIAYLSYHIGSELFPIEYRSVAAGTMNFGGRSVGAAALIIVEYTKNPVLYILIICVPTVLAVIFMMRDRKSVV